MPNPRCGRFFHAFLPRMLETIKDDLMMFGEFYERGVMNKAMRSTLIVLIHKKDGVRELREYHPISLVSSVYKIIFKVLSMQFRGLMGMLVSSTQSAFIQGR